MHTLSAHAKRIKSALLGRISCTDSKPSEEGTHTSPLLTPSNDAAFMNELINPVSHQAYRDYLAAHNQLVAHYRFDRSWEGIIIKKNLVTLRLFARHWAKSVYNRVRDARTLERGARTALENTPKAHELYTILMRTDRARPLVLGSARQIFQNLDDLDDLDAHKVYKDAWLAVEKVLTQSIQAYRRRKVRPEYTRSLSRAAASLHILRQEVTQCRRNIRLHCNAAREEAA